MAGAETLLTTPLLAASSLESDTLSLDDEAAMVNMLSKLQTGPPVPPLPPNGCYGTLYISSAILESLGAAAEAVEAAARDLGDKPVKVLLPWYPTNGGTSIFDHTKPAKVVLSS